MRFAALACGLVSGLVSGSALAASSVAATPTPDIALDPFELHTWNLPGAAFSIAQSPEGFLFIGTSSGLRRFDGVTFRELDVGVPRDVADNNARRVLATRDGALFIATGSGFVASSANGDPYFFRKSGVAALVRHAAGKFTAFTTRDGLPSNWIWALAEDPTGAVFVGTETGLAVFRDGRITRVDREGELPSPVVLALLQHPSGDLFIGTQRGLVVRRNGRLESTPIAGPVVALARGPGNSVWVGRNRSVVRFGDGATIELRIGRPPVTLASDANGHLWVGSDRGLSRIEEDQAGLHEVETAIKEWANSSLADRDGNLWVGSRIGGLAQLRPPLVRSIGEPEGLKGRVAFAVIAAHDGAIWTATTDGLSRIADGRLHNWSGKVDFESEQLVWLAEGHDGSIWAGSSAKGLVRWKDGAFRTYRQKDGLPSDEVRTILVDRGGDLWVGSVADGVMRYRGAEVDAHGIRFGTAQGLCPGPLSLLAEARAGGLWFGGPQGLSFLSGDHGRCFTTRDGLPSDGIRTIGEDSDGVLWIGTSDAGLVRFAGGKFTRVPAHAALPSLPIAVVDDNRGHLWMTSGLGVYRMRKTDLGALVDGKTETLDVLVYNAQDGMRSPECTDWVTRGPAVDREGHVWVPTLAGLTVLPQPEETERSGVDVFIDRILVDRRSEGPAPPSLRLPRGGGEVEVEFTAPDFLSPGRLSFRYRMDGLDTRWVDAGTERRARYAQVGPGEYLFHVAAFDRLGRPAGKEARFSLRVPPPFYQTGGFIAACLGFAVLMAFGLHRLRVRRVEARHAVVLGERARIARDLHDTLGQSFASIGMHVDGLRVMLADAPEPVRNMLEQTRHVIELCHEETRRPIWNIRSKEPPAPSLGALLKDVVAGFTKGAAASGTAIALDVPGPPQPVPALVQHEIGHIAREAISNAVRHARATRIAVESYVDGEGLVLIVRDNGVGIGDVPDLPPGEGGVGLLGMRERASRIHGVLSIVLADGGGTQVSLFLPRAELDRMSASKQEGSFS